MTGLALSPTVAFWQKRLLSQKAKPRQTSGAQTRRPKSQHAREKTRPLRDREITIRRIEAGIAIVAVALIVYFHFVFMFHAGALWRDEVNTVEFATTPSLADLWNSLQYDSFPVFSTLVLRAWIWAGGGATDLRLRTFGFLIGISILAALGCNAWLVGYAPPLLSLALLAFSPLAIRFGDSLRPYGIGLVFILLTFGLMWKVTVEARGWQIAAATVSAVLSVQCLYQNAFLLMAVCLGGIVVTARNGFWKRSVLVLGVGVAAALSLVPYADSIRRAQDWAVLNQVPVTFLWIWTVLSQALGSGGAFMTWLWLALGAAAILAVLLTPQTQLDLNWFAATTIIAATIAFLFFIELASLPSQPWYYLPLLAICAVSLDALVSSLSRRISWRLFRMMVAVFVLVSSFPFVVESVQVRQTNVDLVASRLHESTRKNDLILVSPWYHGVSFRRYYKGETAWITVPPLEDLRIHRYDLLKLRMTSPDPIEPLLTRIAETLRSGHRVWIVGGLHRLPQGQKPPAPPPAPEGPAGWNNDPYLSAWAMQVGYFIQLHARSGEFLPIPCDAPINPYENLPVEVVQGWR